MKRYILTMTLAGAALTTLTAQPLAGGESHYRYADATQLWRATDMAAGLQLDSAGTRGTARFDVQHHEGDYHRVQEGGQQNRLSFFTERYQPVGRHLYGYGRFTFDMGRTKQRAWSDVQRTYLSDPFLTGSSVAGKYDHQRFDFTAAVGTRPLLHGTAPGDGLRLGARLDYQVGDLSRLRDPRTRSQLLDYRLTPSLTYTAGAHTAGVSGYYHRRKEKIPNTTTVQDDPDLAYYLMSGLEAADGTTGGYKGFNREWVNHEFGATLAYGYRHGHLTSLTTAGLSRGRENIFETYRREPGRYDTYAYRLLSQNRLRRGRLLHQLDLRAELGQAYADEYRQQLRIDNDAQTGYTSLSYETLITFRKRYQLEQYLAALSYRLNLTRDERVTAYAGMRADATGSDAKHLLPTSRQRLAATDWLLEAGGALLGQGRLWADAQAGYHHAATADLQLADALTDYAVNVLLPDMDYYGAHYWQERLALTYQFPVRLKQSRALWYVRGWGQCLQARGGRSALNAGLTLGIYN